MRYLHLIHDILPIHFIGERLVLVEILAEHLLGVLHFCNWTQDAAHVGPRVICKLAFVGRLVGFPQLGEGHDMPLLVRLPLLLLAEHVAVVEEAICIGHHSPDLSLLTRRLRLMGLEGRDVRPIHKFQGLVLVQLGQINHILGRLNRLNAIADDTLVRQVLWSSINEILEVD